MFEGHAFVASRTPTPRDLHALATHLTGKGDAPPKFERNGRVVTVVTRKDRLEGRSIELERNAFVYRRTVDVAPWTAKIGDIATVSARLCYTIHQRNAAGKLCKRSPFDPLGRLQRQYRTHFLHYLERATGLGPLSRGTAELGFVVPADIERGPPDAKVWFNGVIDLTIRARVVEDAVFNALAGTAIGNRRSYGFGAVSCDDLERSTEAGLEHEGEVST